MNLSVKNAGIFLRPCFTHSRKREKFPARSANRKERLGCCPSLAENPAVLRRLQRELRPVLPPVRPVPVHLADRADAKRQVAARNFFIIAK
jgi:hypothetical protein